MDPADFQKLAGAMASGEAELVFRAMWELNLSPGFREDASRYAAFVEMATALPSPQETIELQMRAIVGHDTSARLPGLQTPTLVIHGTVDRVLPPANGSLIDSLLPNSRLEPLEDIGHMFWWEQPQRCAELIREHAQAAA
jgi:pimeloyl-ACP methyl ester carboxylesterase